MDAGGINIVCSPVLSYLSYATPCRPPISHIGRSCRLHLSRLSVLSLMHPCNHLIGIYINSNRRMSSENIPLSSWPYRRQGRAISPRTAGSCGSRC
jgi:hypothetical protein